MAHIFKHPLKSNKGIVIFTHKEWRHFSGGRVRRNVSDLVQRQMSEPKANPVGFFKNQLNEIRKKYFVGIHFGGYQFRYQLNKIPFASDYADFVMSVESTLPNLSPDLHRIPLNCRNFIPREFDDQKRQKQWDFIAVGRDVTVKNYPKLFISIQRVLQVDSNATFLLIVPSQKNMKAGAHSSLASLYYQTFSREEQKQISFLYLHPELDVGISQSQLVRFYNLSKVFTLFSSQLKTRFFEYGEGDSRVISEALCCNLPVVCYAGMRGGGRDFLTNENSVLFEDYDTAHMVLLEAREKFADGILDDPKTITREDYSLEKLNELFGELYKKKGQEYDGSLINCDALDTRIPAHFSDVPWKLDPLQPTADLQSRKQFNVFMRSLKLD